MIGFMVRVMMSWLEGCWCLILSTSMVMNPIIVDLFHFLLFQLYFHSCICGDLHSSESLIYSTSELIAIFECSLTDCVLWVLWHIIWWPEWYNDVCYLVFFKWQDQKLLQTIFWHWEFYITFYRSGVSEHCDVGEHVVVWSPVKFCSANFDGSWMKFVALVST